jgi:ZIP family zinc transporter
MFLSALGYSMAAGLATMIGALIVFIRPRVRRGELVLLIGLAAGVMVSMVLFALLPVIIVHGDYAGFLLGSLGILTIIITARCLFATNNASDSLTRLGYFIILGVLLEGMAISLTNEVSSHTAAVLALGIGLHDLPEGMVMAVPFYMAGASKLEITLRCLAVGAITPLGTIMGKIAATFLPDYLSIMMGLAGGTIFFMGLFEIWPEAKNMRSRWAYFGAAFGISIVLLASLV